MVVFNIFSVCLVSQKLKWQFNKKIVKILKFNTAYLLGKMIAGSDKDSSRFSSDSFESRGGGGRRRDKSGGGGKIQDLDAKRVIPHFA